MRLCTASEVISLARQIEEEGARYYEALAQRSEKDRELLLTFARENKKNIAQVERAYYGVISDALEGCFTFDIDPAEFSLGIEAATASYSDELRKAAAMEDTKARFYSRAAEQSKAFLGDVARAFSLIAKKTSARREQVGEMAGG